MSGVRWAVFKDGRKVGEVEAPTSNLAFFAALDAYRVVGATALNLQVRELPADPNR